MRQFTTKPTLTAVCANAAGRLARNGFVH